MGNEIADLFLTSFIGIDRTAVIILHNNVIRIICNKLAVLVVSYAAVRCVGVKYDRRIGSGRKELTVTRTVLQYRRVEAGIDIVLIQLFPVAEIHKRYFNMIDRDKFGIPVVILFVGSKEGDGEALRLNFFVELGNRNIACVAVLLDRMALGAGLNARSRPIVSRCGNLDAVVEQNGFAFALICVCRDPLYGAFRAVAGDDVHLIRRRRGNLYRFDLRTDFINRERSPLYHVNGIELEVVFLRRIFASDLGCGYVHRDEHVSTAVDAVRSDCRVSDFARFGKRVGAVDKADNARSRKAVRKVVHLRVCGFFRRNGCFARVDIEFNRSVEICRTCFRIRKEKIKLIAGRLRVNAAAAVGCDDGALRIRRRRADLRRVINGIPYVFAADTERNAVRKRCVFNIYCGKRINEGQRTRRLIVRNRFQRKGADFRAAHDIFADELAISDINTDIGIEIGFERFALVDDRNISAARNGSRSADDGRSRGNCEFGNIENDIRLRVDSVEAERNLFIEHGRIHGNDRPERSFARDRKIGKRIVAELDDEIAFIEILEYFVEVFARQSGNERQRNIEVFIRTKRRLLLRRKGVRRARNGDGDFTVCRAVSVLRLFADKYDVVVFKNGFAVRAREYGGNDVDERRTVFRAVARKINNLAAEFRAEIRHARRKGRTRKIDLLLRAERRIDRRRNGNVVRLVVVCKRLDRRYVEHFAFRIVGLGNLFHSVHGIGQRGDAAQMIELHNDLFAVQNDIVRLRGNFEAHRHEFARVDIVEGNFHNIVCTEIPGKSNVRAAVFVVARTAKLAVHVREPIHCVLGNGNAVVPVFFYDIADNLVIEFAVRAVRARLEEALQLARVRRNVRAADAVVEHPAVVADKQGIVADAYAHDGEEPVRTRLVRTGFIHIFRAERFGMTGERERLPDSDGAVGYGKYAVHDGTAALAERRRQIAVLIALARIRPVVERLITKNVGNVALRHLGMTIPAFGRSLCRCGTPVVIYFNAVRSGNGCAVRLTVGRNLNFVTGRTVDRTPLHCGKIPRTFVCGNHRAFLVRIDVIDFDRQSVRRPTACRIGIGISLCRLARFDHDRLDPVFALLAAAFAARACKEE